MAAPVPVPTKAIVTLAIMMDRWPYSPLVLFCGHPEPVIVVYVYRVPESVSGVLLDWQRCIVQQQHTVWKKVIDLLTDDQWCYVWRVMPAETRRKVRTTLQDTLRIWIGSVDVRAVREIYPYVERVSMSASGVVQSVKLISTATDEERGRFLLDTGLIAGQVLR